LHAFVFDRQREKERNSRRREKTDPKDWYCY